MNFKNYFLLICIFFYNFIEYIFKADTDGEVSFEIVRLIAQNLTTLKYDVDEAYIRILSSVKLHVHANDSDSIRKQAKLGRKKRKNAGDDIESSLLEAEAINKTTIKRFQLDSLHEICLIYFRIIKNKIGFKLFPVALEGMGKISHQVNIDTIEDLVILLKSYLPKSENIPVNIRLHCVFCALRTLAGPGMELQMDSTPFLDSLHEMLIDLPTGFQDWDVLLNCIELGFLKRKEIRPEVITYLGTWFSTRRNEQLICTLRLLIPLSGIYFSRRLILSPLYRFLCS